MQKMVSQCTVVHNALEENRDSTDLKTVLAAGGSSWATNGEDNCNLRTNDPGFKLHNI